MANIKQLKAILRKYKDEHKVNYSKLTKPELINLINKLGLSHLIPKDEEIKILKKIADDLIDKMIKEFDHEIALLQFKPTINTNLKNKFEKTLNEMKTNQIIPKNNNIINNNKNKKLEDLAWKIFYNKHARTYFSNPENEELAFNEIFNQIKFINDFGENRYEKEYGKDRIIKGSLKKYINDINNV